MTCINNARAPYRLLCILVVYAMFSLASNYQDFSRSTINQHLKTPLAASSLRTFLNSFAFATPVLIIDTVLLQAIINGTNTSEVGNFKLRIAVHDRFRSIKISEDTKNLEVIFYSESSLDRDYWLFEFGKQKRAMRPFAVSSNHHPLVYLPSDIQSFLDEWKFSEMLDCNNMLQRNDNEKRAIPLHFIREMAVLRDFIQDRNAKLILAGGTLLGWYRECSLIAHTTDIDFFIRVEDYNPSILLDLDEDVSPYKVSRIYGQPSDSYELTLVVKKFPDINIDLFFLYTNLEESFVGGLDWYTRKKYKWTYPRITSLCAADLLGQLFHVPCNTKEVLDMEYYKWREDTQTNDFIWYKSHRNVHENGFYTKEEMEAMRPPGWRWVQDFLSLIVRNVS